MGSNKIMLIHLLLTELQRILRYPRLIFLVVLGSQSLPTLAHQNIVTGRSSSDTISYWNCSLLDSRTSEVKGSNHHIRFWANGLGRSGQSNFVWSASSDDGLDLLVSGKQVAITDIEVRNVTNTDLSETSTTLTMTDNNNDVFNCELVGGNYQANDGNRIILQDSSLPLLEYHLSGDGYDTWVCETAPEVTILHGSIINFKKNGDVTVNDTSGRWYVDNLYFLNITLDSNVHVVMDIEFENGLNKFSGLFQNSTIKCTKTD